MIVQEPSAPVFLDWNKASLTVAVGFNLQLCDSPKDSLLFIPAASGLPSCTLRFSHLSTGTFGAKHLSQQPRGHRGAQEQGEADSEPRCARQPILSRRHLLTCLSCGLKQSFPLESTDAPRGKLSKLEACVHTSMQS